jgi:Ca2+-binding RTX toxin-like protein
VDLTAANVRIYNAAGTLVDSANYAANGVSVTASLTDESVTITGLKDDWSYQIVTDAGHKFDAIQVEALSGTDNFSLGFFTYGLNDAGAPIELHYGVTGTDGDGDTVGGIVDVTLYPDAVASSGSSLTGTASGDILLGTNSADTISGLGGADTIAGNSGNDILTGGAGDDILTGGSGSDTFKFSTVATNGKDAITDFTIGSTGSGGDVLDIAELLSGAGKTSSDFTGNPGGYLYFQSAGATTTEVVFDADGSGSGGQVVATLQNVNLADHAALLTELLNNGEIKTT